MRITDIAQAVRNPQRVNIFVDAEYRFSLDISQVTDLGIRIGQEVTEEDLAGFQDESLFGKVYVTALEYCLRRPHSAKEIRDYLSKKTRQSQYRARHTGEIRVREGVPVAVVNRVFDTLEQKGHIDDQKFTEWWIENRFQSKGVSKRRLQNDLMAKGIPPHMIEAVYEASSRNDQGELSKVIQKKQSRYTDRNKFIQYLLRQGFRYDDIAKALNHHFDE